MQEWGISERAIRTFCNDGRIQGVTKVGEVWQNLEYGYAQIFFEKTDEHTSVYFRDKKYGNVDKNIQSIRDNIL